MRIVNCNKLKEEVKRLSIEASYCLSDKVISVYKEALKNEDSEMGKYVIEKIIENSLIAKNENIPICQDTGIVVVFLEIGEEVFIEGNITSSINEGIKEAYLENDLRCSVVNHPIKRINTFSNTPAIIHLKQVKGDKIKIIVCPKGAGSENMSNIALLPPSKGLDGVIEFVIDCVKKAGGKVCPPMIVGVGIGGDFEKCALLSKEALTRDILDESDDEVAKELEKTLLRKINDLGIGPMGFGGKETAFAVKVNMYPCHIASLPVACNFQCHAIRHKEAII